jgi:hypothetical protein
MGLNLDIDGWLRGIGLEQYAQTFRDNAIDADVLCSSTLETTYSTGSDNRFGIAVDMVNALPSGSGGLGG